MADELPPRHVPPRLGVLDDGGFTLIEIMVALAVFSLAAMALVRLESATVRGVSIVDETTAAGVVARTVAAEAVSDVRAPTLGAARGTEQAGGRAWGWVRNVSRVGDAGVLRIDVAVAGADGRVIGRATVVRPPDAGPQL